MTDHRPEQPSLVRPAFGVDPDEPAVHHPQLRAWVELAAAEPVPRVTVDVAAVRRAWQRRRATDRRRAVLVMVAMLVLAVGWSWGWPRIAARNPPVALQGGVAMRVDADVAPRARYTPPAVADAPSHATLRRSDDLVEGLAAGVSVRTEQVEAVEVLDDDTIAVGAGVFHIDVAAGAAPLRVQVDTRVLRLEPGTEVALTVPDSGEPIVTRRSGRATWERSPARSRGARSEASAAALARRADEQMKAGQRAAAIETLERLVEGHPRSAAARTGLLDLARLRRQVGQADGARCAYAAYLRRWPSSTLRVEIQRELDRLGPGRACRGIQPASP